MTLPQPADDFKSKIQLFKRNEVLIGLLTFVVYISSLLNDFHTDDWIVLNRLRDGFSFNDFLSMENPGRFRPLTNIIVYARYWLFGDAVSFYYLLNIALHAFVSILLYRFLLKLKLPERTALIASIFFVLYFQHYEAVIWLYGIIRMLAAIFYIVSLWLLYDFIITRRRKSMYLFILISILGFFVVEDFVVAPLAFTAFAVIFSEKGNLRKDLVLIAAGGAGGLIVYFILRTALIIRPTIIEDYYYPGLHFFRVLFDYIGWFVIPSPSHPYFANVSSSLGAAYFLWAGIYYLAVIGFIPLCAWIFYKAPRGVRFFILMIFITMIPIMPLNYKVTSRNIYLPSMGLAVLGGYIFDRLIWYNKNKLRKLLTGSIIIIYFGVNIAAIDLTTREYRNTQAIVRSMIEDFRQSGLDFRKCEFVLLDNMPGRSIAGPAMVYLLNNRGYIIASNDPVNGPYDIKAKADSLFKEGTNFYLFDYRNGHMVNALDEYIGKKEPVGESRE